MTNPPWLPLYDPALLARAIRIPVDPATLLCSRSRSGKSPTLALLASQLGSHKDDEASQ